MVRALRSSVLLASVALTLAFTARTSAHPPAPAYSPPTLDRYVAPAYPEDARRRGVGGSVLLRLRVGADGHVSEAWVVGRLDPSCDQAAVAAARALVFHPARLGPERVAATVDFEYHFTPPGHAHAGAPHLGPEPAPLLIDTVEQVTVVESVDAERPLAAASARTVRDRDLALRPIVQPADIFRVTPGLMVVQHAGGGKATQYLLRGFDADHGTDVSFTLDGMPLNMVSHGHGQGYADPNFIIPELIERVEVSKGPYFVDQGDLSTAGSIDLVTRDRAQSFVSFGGGSFGTRRAVAIASPAVDGGWHPLLAAEAMRTDGPFEHPERFDKFNLYGKLTREIDDHSKVSMAASTYAGSWRASGQLPSRAVRQGLVDFFGALDPTEGGASSRHNLALSYRLRPHDHGELVAMAYVTKYDFALYSNFTFFSRDETNGDQIEQRDDRTILGARSSYRWLRQWRGILFDSTVGGSARTDAIVNGLARARARERLEHLADADIHQTSVGVFAKEEVQLARWLRLAGGVRADHFNFAVNDRLEDLSSTGTRTSGARGSTRLSPKGTLVLSPHRTTDLFVNFGYGFHSNDARGVVRSVDPVTPLTRTVGYELGARTRLLERRLQLAVALWGIDIDSETVWVGDEGTTEAGPASRRVGAEAEVRWEILPWLFADADVTVADARFRGNAGNGRAVALAPRVTASGGLAVAHPAGWRAAVRGLYIAERPATEDAFLRAEATYLLDAFAAYRWRAVQLAIDVENLLDRRFKAAQFATVTRLPGEPSTAAPPPANACPPGTRAATDEGTGNFQGCEDVSFSPGVPLSVRVTGTYYF